MILLQAIEMPSWVLHLAIIVLIPVIGGVIGVFIKQKEHQMRIKALEDRARLQEERLHNDLMQLRSDLRETVQKLDAFITRFVKNNGG